MSTNKMADTGSHMSNSTQKSSNKLKYTTFVGNGDMTASKTNENVSLQEAFKRYRKQRQKELRKARRLRKRWELRQGDPDKMTALRMKFIAQAKKYIGVPYAKKYWPQESPEYKSKLFLDCCGLVRQVMRDLVEDFGFYIGPWNQAYMYDTLPITVDNEKDMKPGDLVFISATYFNPKSKKQRHNMTHVEIWAGQGPKTIGSRWNNGKVQIWDDYKFTAKSYYDETYHFKSIDTWLMGICESHCSQHRWKKTLYNPSKKSVFAVEEDDQEQDNSQDEAAGDDDDNVTDDVVSSIRDMKNQIEDDVASIAKGVIDLDNPSEPSDEAPGTESAGKKSRGKKSPGSIKKETKLPTCSLPSNMQPTFFVGGGNGVSLVEGPLTNLGWKRTTDKYDERFRLKWVECKSKINYGAFREGEQLVNHLPNSHLLTNKLGLLNSLKEYERVTLSTKGRLPRLKMSEFHPETYKLDEKGDRELFLEVYKDGEIWIIKPIGMNQGKGIFLVRSKEAINTMLEERDQRKQMPQKPGKPLATRIAQRYIMNPLLLDGRKFDVRAYMLVASTTPYLILYHKGYVRLSCHKYNESDLSMSTHLTNQFIQKKDPAYKELKEDTAWSMDKFNDYVNEDIRPNSKVEFEEDWVYNTFTKQMQKIMIHCFNSVKHKIQCRLGFFDLFGLDFMVDTDMRVWLLEMNVNPCLARNCKALKAIIPGVIKESLYVSIECFEKSKKNQPLMPLQSLKSFTILYCGTRPNTIIPRQSRSVSPVKDNSSTASERSKPMSTGASSRPTHRLLTQSTPLVAASSTRKSIDKSDTHSIASQSNRSESNFSAKTNSSTTSAKLTLPAIVTKSEDVKSDRRVGKSESRYTKTEFSATKTDHKLAKSDIIVAKTVNQDNTTVVSKSGNRLGKEIPDSKKKDNKDRKQSVENKEEETINAEEIKDIDKVESDRKDIDMVDTDNKAGNDVDNRELEKRLNEQDEEKKTEIGTKEEEHRASVVDTLARTQNSLNLATSALGKINISLNQVGLTDSLLEEVRLKMTHADPPALGGAKPNSARVQRGRENLDRGN